jgi:hypothetical protein
VADAIDAESDVPRLVLEASTNLILSSYNPASLLHVEDWVKGSEDWRASASNRDEG